MAYHRCAICGDSIDPALSLKLPRECIRLMANSYNVDAAQIEDGINVHFCSEDASRVEQLVEKGKSPLSECNATYAEFIVRDRGQMSLVTWLSPTTEMRNNTGKLSRAGAR